MIAPALQILSSDLDDETAGDIEPYKFRSIKLGSTGMDNIPSMNYQLMFDSLEAEYCDDIQLPRYVVFNEKPNESHLSRFKPKSKMSNWRTLFVINSNTHNAWEEWQFEMMEEFENLNPTIHSKDVWTHQEDFYSVLYEFTFQSK